MCGVQQLLLGASLASPAATHRGPPKVKICWAVVDVTAEGTAYGEQVLPNPFLTERYKLVISGG